MFKQLLFYILISHCLLSFATPYRPSSDAEILQHLPSVNTVYDQELRYWQRQLNTDTGNLTVAVKAANLLIDKVKIDGDPRYYGYAQAAVKSWWQQAEPPVDVLLLKAAIKQHNHDFQGALTDLQTVLNQRPDNAQAWLSQAVIQTVIGNYDAAMQSCQRLKRLSTALIYASCMANTVGLQGKAESAFLLLQETEANASQEQDHLWALTLLAELATRLGKNNDAERYFKQALALPEADVYALSAYCDFLLDTGKPKQVVELIKDNYRSDALLLRLTLAEQTLGSTAAAQHLDELKLRMAAYRLRQETLHQREEARVYLELFKQPEQALKLALANWQVQKEPWDARLVLAAAVAAHDITALNSIVTWLKQAQLQDVQINALVTAAMQL